MTLCVEGCKSCFPNIGLWNLAALNKLAKLIICSNTHQSEDITPLLALTGLQDIRLCYDSIAAATAAATAWRQLWQLQCLDISSNWDPPGLSIGAAEIIDLLQGLEAATSSTCLVLHLPVRNGARLELCRSLSGLTGLQMLSLEGLHQPGALAASDALHLSSLKGLTDLSFGAGCPSGVEDMVAVALAGHLTRLQYLSFTGCGLTTAAVILAIALDVKQRTCLFLLNNPHHFTADDITMLPLGLRVVR